MKSFLVCCLCYGLCFIVMAESFHIKHYVAKISPSSSKGRRIDSETSKMNPRVENIIIDVKQACEEQLGRDIAITYSKVKCIILGRELWCK